MTELTKDRIIEMLCDYTEGEWFLDEEDDTKVFRWTGNGEERQVIDFDEFVRVAYDRWNSHKWEI